MKLQLTGAALALSLLATSALAGESTTLRAVPAQLDLGTVAIGEKIHARILLVNDGSTPVEVAGAKGTCGCTKLPDFEAATLAPRHGQVVDVVVQAPDKTADKQVRVQFLARDGGLLEVPVSLTTSADATPAATPDPSAVTLHAFADAWSFTGAPESSVEGSMWLVNAADETREVLATKGSCGCMSVAGEKTYRLAPGEARLVSFRVELPKKPGEATKKLTFVTDSGPLVTSWQVTTLAPRVAAR